MRTHRTKVTVPADHQLAVRLPDDFPAGPAEVLISADTSTGRRTVKLADILAPDEAPLTDTDLSANALGEFRREREQSFEKLETGTRSQEVFYAPLLTHPTNHISLS